jgi:hypothetical protein
MPPPSLPHRLYVVIEGGGRVEADDGSISCPGKCIAEFPQPRQLMLKATADINTHFGSWGDACGGNQACAVEVNGSPRVQATFRPVVQWAKPVSRSSGMAMSGDDVYVVGHFQDQAVIGDLNKVSNGNRDVYVARFDVTGRLQWLNTFGGSGTDEGRDVTVVPGDQIVVTGDLVGSELDSQGRVVPGREGFGFWFTAWYSISGQLRRVLRDVGALAIASDAQGNIALGTTPPSKYSPSGTKLWEAADNYNYYLAQKLAFDRAGNLIIANTFAMPVTVGGRTHNPVGPTDVIVAKYSPSGNVLWSTRIGQQRHEYTKSLSVDANGDVYLTGETYDLPPSPNRGVYFVALSSSDGSVKWNRTFDSVAGNAAGAILPDSSGSAFASARVIGSGATDPTSFLFRLDARTGMPLATKEITTVPLKMVLHSSGDVLGVDWELARMTVKW